MAFFFVCTGHAKRAQRGGALSLSLLEAGEAAGRRGSGGGRRSFPASSASSADGDERCDPAPQHQVEARRGGQVPRRRRGGLEDADGHRGGLGGGGGGRSSRGSSGRRGSSGSGRRCCRSRCRRFRRRHRRFPHSPSTSAPFERPRLPLARGGKPAQRHHRDSRQNQRQGVLGVEEALRCSQSTRGERASLAKQLFGGPRRAARPLLRRGSRDRGGGLEPLLRVARFLGDSGEAALGEVEGRGGEREEAGGEGGNGGLRWRRRSRLRRSSAGVVVVVVGGVVQRSRRCRRGWVVRCLRFFGLHGPRGPRDVPPLRGRRVKLS